jgi:choline dehydrogenase-like flavoprotein
VKERYPAYVVLSPYGEMLPNPACYIDLDESRKDQFGLPVARRTVAYSDNDMKIFRDMNRWARDIGVAAGAEILSVSSEPRTNHELGGARMGSDPRRSVVDAFCRTHDVPNLYVVDGSVFPSASEKNPTHTIMALAARTAEHIAEQLRKGDL